MKSEAYRWLRVQTDLGVEWLAVDPSIDWPDSRVVADGLRGDKLVQYALELLAEFCVGTPLAWKVEDAIDASAIN